LARLEAQNESLQALLNDLKEKVELLRAAEAGCPLCQAPLTPEHRDEVLKMLRAEGRAARQRLKENAAAVGTAQETLRVSAAEMSALQAQIAELPRLGQTLGKQESELAAARAAEQERAAVLSARQQLEARLAAGTFATEERARLAAIDREIAALGYDEAEHAAIGRQLQEQAPFERRQLELRAAEQRLPADRAALEQAQRADAEQQAAIAQAETEAGVLEKELAALPALETHAQSLAAQRRELQGREVALRDEVTRDRARVARYDDMRADLAARAAAQAQAEQDASVYGELATAFSKDGVQALIIENALPDLTEHANEILRRLTEGRMRVQFVTQKESTGNATTSAGAARSGETLDLQISDELGTRRYELYSGGEAFRVDFAVRLALSRLLAHRAGTRLQTLIIDEGFGTQDRAALDRLVQAIRAIQGDFERIVVITHIEELKEAFDTRIEVTKDEDGSHLAVFAGPSDRDG
jgi:exonuclease SbcC